MKWAKERDGLIAQTRAFVNSVIVWKANTAPPSEAVQPVAIENTFAVSSSTPAERIVEPDATEPGQRALPIAELPSPKLPSATHTVENDVRNEIQSRIAAFQAHQHRFAQEREVYFNSVLTKARSALDGGRNEVGHDKPSA